MNEVLHLPAKHFSGLIIVQLHCHISSYHHISRKVIGILEHTHIAGIVHTIQSIRDLAGLVHTLLILDRAATVLIICRSLLRLLAVFHHIERKLSTTIRRKFLKIYKICRKETCSIFTIILRRCIRIHIDNIMPTSLLSNATIIITQKIRFSRDIDHPPLPSLKLLNRLSLRIRRVSRLENKLNFRINTLKFDALLNNCASDTTRGGCRNNHPVNFTSHGKISVPAHSGLIKKHFEILNITLIMNSRRQQIRRNLRHIRVQIRNHIDLQVCSSCTLHQHSSSRRSSTSICRIIHKPTVPIAIRHFFF